MSATVTSDILSLSSPEMNVRYSATAGRDYCDVGLKRAEKMERRKMCVHRRICDGRNIELFWGIFENMRRDKAKFFNYFRMSLGS